MIEVLEPPAETIETTDEHDDPCEMVAHLYVQRVHALCGISTHQDPHLQMHRNYGMRKFRVWRSGMKTCPLCGAMICADCYAIAETNYGSKT